MSREEQYLRIAVIMGPHALNGRLKVNVISDNPGRFREGHTVFIFENNVYNKYIIEEFKQLKEGSRISLLRISGVKDRTTALSYKGKEIFITKQEAEETRDQLQDDGFYYFDLIGCEVYLNGDKFAEVTEIIEAGGGDTLVITDPKGRRYLIPFTDSMVDTSQIREKRLDIHPIEGLLDI